MQNAESLTVASILAVAIVIAPGAGGAEAANRWQWSLTPYMWATDVSETPLLDGSEVGGDDTEFSDLVDTLDTSLQLHFEGVGERCGVFADVTYIELADSAEGELGFGRLDVEKTLSGFVRGLKIGF